MKQKKEHGLNHTLSCFYCFTSAFKKINASLLFSISYPFHFLSKALESNTCNTTTAYPLGVYGLRYHLSSTLVLILKYQKQIRLPVFHHQYQNQTAIKKRDQPKSVSILFFYNGLFAASAFLPYLFCSTDIDYLRIKPLRFPFHCKSINFLASAYIYAWESFTASVSFLHLLFAFVLSMFL